MSELIHSLTYDGELQNRVQGTVLVPGNSEYESARKAWNLTVEQYPARILIAANAQDIAEGVTFARAMGLGVAVQATGHGVILPADDALLIVTSTLNNVEVDAASATAWVDAGAIWANVLEKAQAVGLAPLLGSSSGVGAVGYTLGGGMGWLARKHGLATDSAIEFEVVTADGRLIHTNETENSDLYWVLRGGGGSFAIVTSMKIKLYPVTEIYGGSLIYPAANAKEVFTFYREWIHWLPEDWTTSIAIMNFPPMPNLPPFLSGQSVVMVNGVYSGSDLQMGMMMAQAWPDWMQPIVNGFHKLPFSEIDSVSNDPLEPSAGKSSGAWLSDLSDAAIDTLVQHAVGSRLMKIEIRYAGGAVNRTQNNAFGHRDANHIMQIVAMVPAPDAEQQVEADIAALKHSLTPYLTGGVYMNFLEGKESRQETRNGFPVDKFNRLMQLKAKYDPDNIFRFGFNIPPKR